MIGLLSPALAKESKPMSETVIDGIRISFTGPDQLPLEVVSRDSPAYDAPRNFFTVTMKNESERSRKLPFDELRRTTVLVYGNPDTKAQEVDNESPPPRRVGLVETLPAGEQRAFQVVFAYPARIAPLKDGAVRLRFCVRWEAAWLRAASYTADAYDWNHSFQLCRDLQITSG